MDSDLIRRAQDGDEQALAELLKKHYSFIVKYVWKMSGDEQLAYDVTQDALTKAIQKINQFNHRSKFSTWLIQIATHTYLDYKRKQKKKNELDEKLRKEFLHSPVSFPSDWHEVQEALWKLEDEHRIPLVLKHYYGYDYKDIAKMTKVKVGTVKSRVHYGLENLRKELRTDDR
ncbi:RNA polymerase sigma factor SigY [Halobacillus trueperi]|uniref:RNA polymerase sigma factor SigY n=1 Tax=Halobacillus trueperi TaxID=156205 RepID=A0A3E0J7C2_9BACI|nr:RNA polymerase sigma factor SigY [Halobacillus trueperi]REJ08644.1 RNA polymerase sigma factor SigY [Halobacillus trueperi]